MKLSKRQSVIESILFASGESVELETISKILKLDESEIRRNIEELRIYYKEENRGMQIVCIENSFQMCTSKDNFDYIKQISRVNDNKKLSQILLETLAIVAYKQPVTKYEIEQIRGVNVDHAINKLLEYNLVIERGRANTIGRPIIFGTTIDFLRNFGFNDISQMPKLEEFIYRSNE